MPLPEARSRFCHLCGRRLSSSKPGQATSFHHPKWPAGMQLVVCQQCLHTRPRCRSCGMPVEAASPHGLCPTCFSLAGTDTAIGASRNDVLGLNDVLGRRPAPTTPPHRGRKICLACGKPIRGSHVEFDPIAPQSQSKASTGESLEKVFSTFDEALPRPYCQACYRSRPACDVCSAPLTDEQWRLSDGRVMCAYCYTSAIFVAADAVALYEEMKRVASEILGLKLNIPTGLALVDRNQLAEVIRQQLKVGTKPVDIGSEPPDIGRRATYPISVGDVPGGDTTSLPELDPQRTLGVYARRGMRRGIYVQTGLPRMLFLQVAAHEFAHAWQGENCPLLRNVLMHEGFAEWVAYRVLGHYGYTRGRERMLARTDLYGQGLKWALDLEAGQGSFGVMELCRKAATGT